MRFALDSNIVVYAFIRDDPARHAAAAELMRRSIDADSVLPGQSIGEFLNVVRRKKFELFAEACAHAERLCSIFSIAETKASDIVAGGELARRHRLQFWDSVLCKVALSAGATVLLTEDLQDGLEIDGLRIANPFNPENLAIVAELLIPTDG